jgi:hypothetical protein
LGGYGAGAAGGIPTLGAGAGAGTGVAGGIPTLGTGAGTGANLGYETLAKEVSGIEQLVNAANYPLPSAVPTVPSVPNVVPPGAEFIPPSNFGPPAVNTPLTDAQYNFLHNSTAGGDLDTVRSIIQNSEPVTSSLTGTAPVSPAPTNPLYQFQGPKIGLEAPPGTFSTPDPLFNITPSTTQGVIPRTSLESSLKTSGDPFYNVNSGVVNSMGYQRPLYDLTSTGVDVLL